MYICFKILRVLTPPPRKTDSAANRLAVLISLQHSPALPMFCAASFLD